MLDDEILSTIVRSHERAAFEGKPQPIHWDVAEYMGAFEETALSANDAEASIFDENAEN